MDKDINAATGEVQAGNATEPMWHARDRKGAIKRARLIDGYVIWSAAPGKDLVPNSEYGYWSDKSGLVRVAAGEEIIWPEQED